MGFSFWKALKVYYTACHKSLSLSPRLRRNCRVIQLRAGCYYRKLTSSCKEESSGRPKEITALLFHVCASLPDDGHRRLIQVLKYKPICQRIAGTSKGIAPPKRFEITVFSEPLSKGTLPMPCESLGIQYCPLGNLCHSGSFVSGEQGNYWHFHNFVTVWPMDYI